MKFLLLILASAACLAQTHVSGPIFSSDTTPPVATLKISWPSFTTAAGQPVLAGTRTVTVVNGVVDILLWPTESAIPNASYVVSNVASGQIPVTERWCPTIASPINVQVARQNCIGGSFTGIPGTSQAVANLFPGGRPCVLGGDGNCSTPGLGGFDATRTSATVLTMTGGLFRGSSTVSSAITGPGAITLTGSGDGNIYFYLPSIEDISGSVVIKKDPSISFSCAGTCSATSNGSSFPSTSYPYVPLWTWHVHSGQWDATGTDERTPFVSQMPISNPVFPGFVGSLPGTCNAGDLFFAIDALAGRNLFFCTGSNTWTQMVGPYVGGSDPGCTLSADEGRIWLDKTTSTTAEKHCLAISGTVGWITK